MPPAASSTVSLGPCLVDRHWRRRIVPSPPRTRPVRVSWRRVCRPVGRRDGDGDVVLQAGVPGGVIWGAGLPTAPDDPAPRAAEGAQRVAVAVAAGAGVGVAVSGPCVPPAAVERERPERVAQPLVAGPAELRVLALARFDRDRCLAAVGRDRVAVWVAAPAVTDLAKSVAAQMTASGEQKKLRKIGPSGCASSARAISASSSRIWAARTCSVLVRRNTIARRVRVSISPARPVGADRNRSSS